MATAALVLLLVALAVWLSATRPSGYSGTTPVDHDRERQLDELRAMAGSRADVGLR